MSAVDKKRPPADPPYYQVRRYGRQWCLYHFSRSDELDIPVRTKLGSHPRYDAIVEYAQQLAERFQRPVRLPRNRP
jgi:hypothetical protein